MHNFRRISILLLLFSSGNLSGLKVKKHAINGNDFFSTTLLRDLDENGITETPKQEVVKLNLKQGFALNQIIEVYSLKGSSNQLCTNHSKQFGLALRNLEAWALKMFDSSSKLQSGILHGNLFEFGDFKQCVSISTKTFQGAIKGKHCTLKIRPDVFLLKKILSFRNVSEKRWDKVKIFVNDALISWSVCIPDSCYATDVEQHFGRLIASLTEGLNVTVKASEINCLTVLDMEGESYSYIELAVIGALFAYVGFIGLLTVNDVMTSKKENGLYDLKHECIASPPAALVKIFSLTRNITRILSGNTNKGSTNLDCVHGIRFLSTCYVIIGHRYLMMMFFPVVNSLQIMDWLLYYRSTAITGGTLCVDTFFMISGMLVSIGYFGETSKRNMNWFIFYFYRFMRITLPLSVVVLWHCTVIQHFGSGPLWKEMLGILQKPCQEYWWATILHIQNYVHPFPLCLTQTWYLTCDMQYYFMSPAILVPLHHSKTFGLFNLVLLYCTSVLINFYLAWVNEYSGGVPVTSQLFATKYFQYHYIAPHVRASPYIIGLGFGYLVYRQRNQRVVISKSVVALGWLVCIFSMLASLMGCLVFFQEDHEYNQLESSLFLAISRSAWTVGIVWLVWACINGYGYPINNILSLHVFKVLGRISYAMYLLHMGAQYLMSGAAKNPHYFSDFSSIHASLGDLLLMTAAGFIFTILFESPLIQGLAFFARKGTTKQIQIKVKPVEK